MSVSGIGATGYPTEGYDARKEAVKNLVSIEVRLF